MITPVWEAEAPVQQKDRFMWMIGNNSLQEAHAYQQGLHGLFTYYLLKGLRGAANLDKMERSCPGNSAHMSIDR